MKFCNKCKTFKLISDFGLKSGTASKVNSNCKECRKVYQREWYKNNSVLHKERTSVANKKQRQKLQKIILEFLTTHPCVDCGESDILVLEFDHIEPKLKSNNIFAIVAGGLGKDTLINEMQKCEIRCCNCHRRKTFNSYKNYRTEFLAGEWNG